MTNSMENFVQVFDHALSPSLCTKMIESFQALARFQRDNGKGIRAGLEKSAWTELDLTPLSDNGFRAMLIDNMIKHLKLYNSRLNLTIPIPPSTKTSEFIMKRYRANSDDNFQAHFDSIGEVSNRYMVFLWYLNEVQEGGETHFVDLGFEVSPKSGRLLMFPPYWMYQHQGRAPISNDKYILSTYFLF